MIDSKHAMVSRRAGINSYWNGETVIHNLNASGVTYLIEECCLWYFLFIERSLIALPGFNYDRYDGPCKKYLGFLDFDFSGIDFWTMPRGEIRAVFMKELYDLLEEHFKGFWFAYFSGSKGFHVYICKPEFIFQAPNFSQFTRDRMIAALQSLLPAELITMMDDSIYAKNKGIRPFTQRNPKNPRWDPMAIFFASPSFEFSGPMQYHFFEWLDECLNYKCDEIIKHSSLLLGKRPLTELPVSALPAKRRAEYSNVPRPLAPMVPVYVDATHLPSYDEKLQALRHFVKEKLGLVALPEVLRISGENIYFAPEDSWCLCSEERTTHQRTKCWWRMYTCKAEQRCLAQRHKDQSFFVEFVPRVAPVPEVDTRNVCNFPAPFSAGQKILVPDSQRYLDPEFMKQQIEPEGSMNMVCSAMGTGKTFCLNKVIQDHPEWKILVIGTRISQCCVYHGVFEGSELYLDIEKDRPLYEPRFLVICLNSLLRILEPGMIVPSYDLLVLDECMTTLSALVSILLASKQCTNQPAIFELFKALMLSSKRTVMMDGLPTAQLYRFLSNPKLNIWSQFKIIQHQRRGEEKQFIFVDDPRMIEDLVKETLASADGSVVVVSDSKTILKHMHTLVPPDVQSATICGDSAQVIKKTATDPDKNWKSLRYLGYNTALGPGASYDAKTKEEGAFDELVVLITCMTCSPSEIYQLISRMRNMVNKRVHVCILDNKTGNSTLDLSRSESELLTAVKLDLLYGIKGTDNFLQSLPLQIGIQVSGESVEPFLGLEVDAERLTLMRSLASEKKMRLVFEQDDFIALLAEDRLQGIKFRDSKRFAEEFGRLVTWNGGTLLYHPRHTIRDMAKKMATQRSWMNGVKQTGKTRESWLFPSQELTDLSDEKKRLITDMIQVGDEMTQQRFFCLVRYFKDCATAEGPMPRFARQIEHLFAGKPANMALGPPPDRALRIGDLSRVASSHTVTAPELCLPLHDLFKELKLSFDLESGLVTGSFTGDHLEVNRHQIVQKLLVVSAARKKIQKDCKTYALNADYTAGTQKTQFYRALKLSLSQVFEWVGFKVKDKCAKRSKKHEYYLCPDVTRLRYALKDLNCDTFEPMTKSEAVLYFSNKYLSV